MSLTASVLDRVGLTESLSDAQALIVRSATQVDSAMIGYAPLLKVIGRAGIGVDNIDLEAATDAGIVVVNAPQANIISAAEHTMAFSWAKPATSPRADAVLRSGVWDRKSFQGVELHGANPGGGRAGTDWLAGSSAGAGFRDAGDRPRSLCGCRSGAEARVSK